MHPVQSSSQETKRTTKHRFTAHHQIDNLGNLHIINQLQPSMQKPIRPYSQPSQAHRRTHTRVKTVRFSLENYSATSSFSSSNNKPLPDFFDCYNKDLKPLPQIPPPPFKIQRKPLPPPKDHFAQVLECKHISIQRLRIPHPHRLPPSPPPFKKAEREEEEDSEEIIALIKIYTPPRRIRIHWLRILSPPQNVAIKYKSRFKLKFPIILILVPTQKLPKRVSKVLLIGQGRRPGTYDAQPEPAQPEPAQSQQQQQQQQQQAGLKGSGDKEKRITLQADLTFSRRPKSSPLSGKVKLREPEEPRRVSTPDLWHPGTRWMD